jgi:hypothetical protein
MNATGKTVVTFDERPKNSPEALDSWFYPGLNYGMEFADPKERAVVTPDDVEALGPTPDNVPTLVTCCPFHSVGAAPERFIVRARQTNEHKTKFG